MSGSYPYVQPNITILAERPRDPRCEVYPARAIAIAIGIILLAGAAIAAWQLHDQLGYSSLAFLAVAPVGMLLIVYDTRKLLQFFRRMCCSLAKGPYDLSEGKYSIKNIGWLNKGPEKSRLQLTYADPAFVEYLLAEYGSNSRNYYHGSSMTGRRTFERTTGTGNTPIPNYVMLHENQQIIDFSNKILHIVLDAVKDKKNHGQPLVIERSSQ